MSAKSFAHAFNFGDIEDADLDVASYQTVSEGGSYAPTQPGIYLGVIRSLRPGEYFGGKGGPEKDGKWKYLKFRPDVELFNEAGTRVSRQDLTFCALDANGRPTRTDGDKTKSAFWEGPKGATGLLSVLLLISGSKGSVKVNFNPYTVVNQIVAVQIGLGAWSKTNKQELQPRDLLAKLELAYGAKPETLEEYQAALAAFNESKGFEQDEDGKWEEGAWSLKNFIIAFKVPSTKSLDAFDSIAAEEDKLHRLPDGRVFLSEKDYILSEDIKAGRVEPDIPEEAPKKTDSPTDGAKAKADKKADKTPNKKSTPSTL